MLVPATMIFERRKTTPFLDIVVSIFLGFETILLSVNNG